MILVNITSYYGNAGTLCHETPFFVNDLFHVTTDSMTGSATIIKFMLQNALSIKSMSTYYIMTTLLHYDWNFFVDYGFSTCS